MAALLQFYHCFMSAADAFDLSLPKIEFWFSINVLSVHTYNNTGI